MNKTMAKISQRNKESCLAGLRFNVLDVQREALQHQSQLPEISNCQSLQGVRLRKISS